MRISIVTLFFLIIQAGLSFGQKKLQPQPQEEICLTSEEQLLYDLIMEYRKSKKLAPIPLSVSLTQVAQLHSKDLHFNRPATGKCNMHSWSKNSGTDDCCYTNDHKEAECMWHKPQEVNGFEGVSFEISHGYSNLKTYEGFDVEATSALEGWKKSSGHNQVIINKGTWAQFEWQSIGIGIYKDFVTVWFSATPDTQTTACE